MMPAGSSWVHCSIRITVEQAVIGVAYDVFSIRQQRQLRDPL